MAFLLAATRMAFVLTATRTAFVLVVTCAVIAVDDLMPFFCGVAAFRVETAYLPNPYHSSTHACDVMQETHSMIQNVLRYAAEQSSFSKLRVGPCTWS